MNSSDNNNQTNINSILNNAIKNSDSAIAITGLLLNKNEELQEKVLYYILNNNKIKTNLQALQDYVKTEYPNDRILSTVLNRISNDIENESALKDAKTVKELVKTISKISSGIKDYKGDPDLWYHLKDQLVSIKIC